MDQNTIRKIIIDATKSLTVHNVEVVKVSGISLHFRIIAEAYASQSTGQRVLTVLNLIESQDPQFWKSYSFSVDPLTPDEFNQFYDDTGGSSGQSSPGDDRAAKPAEA